MPTATEEQVESDVFALDLQVTHDLPGNINDEACTTNDTCEGTCASSCVTHSPN